MVLLDEIEKAHPDIFHILLQLLDEGQLTDSLGRRVDFKNTIVIMTSNIGSRQLKDFGQGIGFDTQTKQAGKDGYVKSVIQKALHKTFAPEFLNRIDDVIVFESLSRESINAIIDIELKGLFDRILSLGYKIDLTDEAKDFIADKGFDSQYGARPLKRAIQKYLEDPMAEVIIESSLEAGDTLQVIKDEKNEDIKIKVKKAKKVSNPDNKKSLSSDSKK